MTVLRGCLCGMMVALACMLVGCQDKDDSTEWAPADTLQTAWVQTLSNTAVRVADPLPDGGVLATLSDANLALWRIWPSGDSSRVWQAGSGVLVAPLYSPPHPRSSDGCLLTIDGFGLSCMDGDWNAVWSHPLDSLYHPWPLCRATDGTLWGFWLPDPALAEFRHGAVHFREDGSIIGRWEYPLPDPDPPLYDRCSEYVCAVVAAPDGGCWIVGQTSYDYMRLIVAQKLHVTRVNPDGSAAAMYRSTSPEGFLPPVAAVVSSNGDLSVLTSNARLVRFNPSGELAASQPPILDRVGGVGSLLVLPDDHLLVGGVARTFPESSGGAMIVELNAAGAFLNQWLSPEYGQVDAMTLADDGKLVIFASVWSGAPPHCAAIKLLRDRP